MRQRVNFLGFAIFGTVAAVVSCAGDDGGGDTMVSPSGSASTSSSAPSSSATVTPTVSPTSSGNVSPTSTGATSTSAAGTTSTGETSQEPAGVSFAADIHPILVAKCGGNLFCHGDDGTMVKYGSATLATSWGVASTKVSVINMRIQAGTMPADLDFQPLCQGADGKPDPAADPKCLTQAELELVAEWAAAGGPE